MSYAPKRPHMSKSHAERILAAHKSTCVECGQPIGAAEPYDIDHGLARELGGSDDDDNLAPIHRSPCHKIKTRRDRRAIAKSNHVRRKHGPAELRKRPSHRLRSRPMPKGRRPIATRPFESRKGADRWNR